MRRVAAHCAVDGHGIIPDGVDLDTKSVHAVTSPLHVPVSYDAFVPKFSIKTKGSNDAPILEAVACTLATRRLTRTLRNHGTRSVMLLDGQEGSELEWSFQATTSEDCSAKPLRGHQRDVRVHPYVMQSLGPAEQTAETELKTS